jgi:hypothetical protein
MRPYTGPRPTLGELLCSSTKWVWLIWERCPHSAPFACAVAVIRWGPDTSSDKLRECTRCTACGHKGQQHPSWAGEAIGFQPSSARVRALGAVVAAGLCGMTANLNSP